MIYPQCYNGTMIPYVNHQGFLLPCCQLLKLYPTIDSIDKTKIDNPFYKDHFSLYKKTYAEIVISDEWNELIDNMYNTRVRSCWYHCGTNQAPRNTHNSHLYENFKGFNHKKVHTKDIKNIQFEFTSRCSLECLYCSRKKQNEIPKNELNKNDLPVELVADVLSFKHWHTIRDCGTYGDSIFYVHYHELLKMMHSYVIDYYNVSIAATGKPQKWWDETHELWKSLNESGIKVIIFWGIDGLEETASKHRIGQNWDEIFSNMIQASKNDINCVWQFIPMSFNEHQIEEARKLAADLGVSFYIRPSDRFDENDRNRPNNNNYFFDVVKETNSKYAKNKPKFEFIRPKKFEI